MRNYILLKVLVALSQYPSSELYRLVVDGKRHVLEQGWLGYEQREPGCLKALFTGLGIAIKDLHIQLLTVDYIKELHRTCSENVQNLEKGNRPGQFRSKPAGWLLDPTTTTLDGIIELLNKMDEDEKAKKWQPGHGPILGRPDPSSGNPPRSLIPGSGICSATIKKWRNGRIKVTNEQMAVLILAQVRKKQCCYMAPQYPEDLEIKAIDLVEQYNRNIISSVDEDAKLNTIIELIYGLEGLHPFSDANGRTFEIALLNRLLLQNGFLPAT
ncbi:MAG TPA: Fic family protein, partial [Gammaproteobacteria bacterium]|nr:Fic family protein [Gammaproteobacteria bacterium]